MGNSGYKPLTEAERNFVKSHPFAGWAFREAAKKASTEAQRRFPGPGLHNGRGDAFRHGYWNALMVKAVDARLAKMFADAHEERAGQPVREKKMDLHNNAVDRETGRIYRRSSDGRIADACVTALKSGRLRFF